MKRRDFKLAVVTGAASGIGQRFCVALATQGCSLVMVDCADLSATVDLVAPFKVNVDTITLDLTDPDAADKIVAMLDQRALNPDLLINNAGIFDFASVSALEPRRLNLYIDLHMRAVTLLSRAMALRMSRTGGGAILNMSSMSCWMPMPGIAMYAATKAYIRVLSRALGTEMASEGVSVTVACPGGIATDLFGLPRNLQRLGVRVGALATPQAFVKGALKAVSRGKRQYINGPVNHLAIPAVAMLPEWARKIIKTKLLAKYGKL